MMILLPNADTQNVATRQTGHSKRCHNSKRCDNMTTPPQYCPIAEHTSQRSTRPATHCFCSSADQESIRVWLQPYNYRNTAVDAGGMQNIYRCNQAEYKIFTSQCKTACQNTVCNADRRIPIPGECQLLIRPSATSTHYNSVATFSGNWCCTPASDRMHCCITPATAASCSFEPCHTTCSEAGNCHVD